MSDAQQIADQTHSEHERRIIGRPFQPGNCANPSGRPKTVAHVRDLCRVYTEEAVTGLVAIARDSKQSGAARVAAWQEVLNRAHGKAPQTIDLSVTVFDSLSPDTRALLNAACELLLARQDEPAVIDVTPSKG